jgi:glycosyltransferase involved in cell wall biosynthesis
MPTSTEAREAEKADGGPKTVVFAGHLLHFAQPLIDLLQPEPRYHVLVDQWEGHRAHDEASSERCLTAADIIFCEWCLGNTVWYSKRKRSDQKLLVRLHRQEFFRPPRANYLDNVAWEAVDAAITIAPHFRDELRAAGLMAPEKVHYIPNLFDTGRFDRPKPASARFEIGVVKYAPMRKRPDLALEILEGLRATEPRFRLSFVGRRPELISWVWNRPPERAFVMQFLEAVEASPHQSAISFEDYTNDMPAWFSRVGVLLSTSDSEGSHQAVAEGMASGAVPVIRNWPGADRLYPSRYVFSSAEEAVARILWATNEDHFQRLSRSVKDWASSRFDTRTVAAQIIRLFHEPVRRSATPGP